MANHKSALKRIRSNEAKTCYLTDISTKLLVMLSKNYVKSTDAKEAETMFPSVTSYD